MSSQASAAIAASVRATFYRGGTSRGLFFTSSSLSRFSPSARDRIICSSMGSPDPDGRQIDGLGGGASSLSKCAIVSLPGDADVAKAAARSRAFPGLAHAENVQRAKDPSSGWDVVYRFGQVPIRGTEVDWGSTCGNLVSAAAQFAISDVIPPSQLVEMVPPPSDPAQSAGRTTVVPVRLFAHDSGNVVTARVPCVWDGARQRWVPSEIGNASIAGVPGTAAGIVIESPLKGQVLSTGNPLDTVEVEGRKIDVTIADTGLPTIFVDARSLDLPLSLLTSHPSNLDSDASAMARLEAVRRAASHLTPSLAAKFSAPAPKICILHPSASYVTTGGDEVKRAEMDVLLRALSNGQVHRTVPATTLSAASSALSYPDSVISRLAKEGGTYPSSSSTRSTEENGGGGSPGGGGDSVVRSLTVGQPAGLSSASVKLASIGREGGWEPRAILMLRTARRIMDGAVSVPGDCVEEVD